MTKMIRKQLFITAEQNRKLKQRAAAAGVSEAELIRAGIDLQLEGKAEKTDWRSLAERLSGSWAEREDLEEEIREIRRTWNRRNQIMSRRTGRS
jgi:hypothetical protein